MTYSAHLSKTGAAGRRCEIRPNFPVVAVNLVAVVIIVIINDLPSSVVICKTARNNQAVPSQLPMTNRLPIPN